MMQSDQTFKEGIEYNDLRSLIDPVVSIDQYKSKMGNDSKIIVLALKVNDQYPAQDLSQFIEKGFKQAIDVDISPGPDEDGKYTVFVELLRNEKLFNDVEDILNNVTNLDENIKQWSFVAYENKQKQDFNKDNFKNSVIVDSGDYAIRHDEEAAKLSERIKFLNSY